MALSFLHQHERGHMRRQWTIERIRTAVLHAEQQLEQAIAATLAENPLRKAIPETQRSAVHDAVVGLVTVFRDHAAGMCCRSCSRRASCTFAPDAPVGEPDPVQSFRPSPSHPCGVSLTYSFSFCARSPSMVRPRMGNAVLISGFLAQPATFDSV